MTRAVFLDKDGTLIEDVPYSADEESVRLTEGAPSALRRLGELGYRLVVVTNQPGIGLGRFSEEAFARHERRLRAVLASAGVALAGFYACPHAPDAGCDCRKPRSGLIERAARDLGIVLERSWMAGDILDDVEAGRRAGCRSILVNRGNETEWEIAPPLRRPDAIAGSLEAAARFIERGGSTAGAKAVFDEGFAAWQSARNVLCVRLDALGDLMMTSPALHALKIARAGRRVTLLTSPAGAQAALLLPFVDDLIVHEASWVKESGARASAAADRRLIRTLRARGFDAAAIFTVYSQSALPAAVLCHLAEIPRRLAHCRENPYRLLTEWRAEREPEHGVRHETRRQLDLVASVGAMTWDERLRARVPEAASGHVERWLARRGIDGSIPIVVVHAGASAPSRRYRPDRFAEAVRRLLEERECSVVFTGVASERPLVERIRSAAGGRTFSCAGLFDIAETTALIARADLLIGNNTGPAHLAAAVGTPVVDLYALTNPQHAPWMVRSRVLFRDVPCRNCHKSVCPHEHHACLDLVKAEEVVRAALELLDQGRPARRPRERSAVS